MGKSKPFLIINCIVEAYSPKQVAAKPSPYVKHTKTRGALRRKTLALQHKTDVFSILYLVVKSKLTITLQILKELQSLNNSLQSTGAAERLYK